MSNEKVTIRQPSKLLSIDERTKILGSILS